MKIGATGVLVLLACLPLAAQPAMTLTLSQAEQLAVQNNPRLSSAKYTAAAAYQVPAQYRANLLPNLSGNFTGVGADNGTRLAAGGLNNPVVYDRLGSGLTATQLITDFGRTNNLISMSKFQAAAQDQIAEATRADILVATSSAYYNLLKAQAVMKVADETVKARQTVSNRVTALEQNGLRSILDVSFANVNLSGAKLLQVQAQNGVAAANARLAQAMGLSNQLVFQPTEESLPAELPDRVVDLISAAIQNRPELKNLRLQQNAAERFVRAEHDLYFPTLGVLGTTGLAPAGVEQVPGRYGAVGLNVSIPIFNGGLFRARQTEAELKAKAANEDITDMQNRVIGDVRVAYLNAVTAHDRMALTREMMQEAQQAMDYAQARFDQGLSSIAELSEAQLNLTSAQIEDVSAKYDYQALRTIVDYQTGVLH